MLERGIEGEKIALAQHLGIDQRGNINIVVGSFCHIGLMVGTVEPIAPSPLFGNMEVGKRKLTPITNAMEEPSTHCGILKARQL